MEEKKRETFKVVVANKVSGEIVIVSEHDTREEVRKAGKLEQRKWKSGLCTVLLAIPIVEGNQLENEE